MDTAKFIKESVRMCNYYHCPDCPAGGADSACISDTNSLVGDDKGLEKYIAIVEKWSKEHPVKTNFDVLKETFPDYVKANSVEEFFAPKGVIALAFERDFLEAEYKGGKECNQ